MYTQRGDQTSFILTLFLKLELNVVFSPGDVVSPRIPADQIPFHVAGFRVAGNVRGIHP